MEEITHVHDGNSIPHSTEVFCIAQAPVTRIGHVKSVAHIDSVRVPQLPRGKRIARQTKKNRALHNCKPRTHGNDDLSRGCLQHGFEFLLHQVALTETSHHEDVLWLVRAAQTDNFGNDLLENLLVKLFD